MPQRLRLRQVVLEDVELVSFQMDIHIHKLEDIKTTFKVFKSLHHFVVFEIKSKKGNNSLTAYFDSAGMLLKWLESLVEEVEPAAIAEGLKNE